jgi:hypothetical protein
MGNPPFRPLREIEHEAGRGDLRMAVSLSKDYAREKGHPIPLGVALRLLPLVAQESPVEYDSYALRWLARWVTETSAATIVRAVEVASALAELPGDPDAFEVLRELVRWSP